MAESTLQENMDLEFTKKLNHLLEARDPELMQRWTEVCEKMGHIVVKLMRERGLDRQLADAVVAYENMFRSTSGSSAKEQTALGPGEKPTIGKRRMEHKRSKARRPSPIMLATSYLPVSRKVGINESNPSVRTSPSDDPRYV
uniref:PH domain-containing protein n=1 Tax=Steinernema glaseri TaxID=37863 RepID=A0A1I7YAP1_9BILA